MAADRRSGHSQANRQASGRRKADPPAAFAGERACLYGCAEIKGPFNASAAPLPESYHRVFLCGHAIGQHTQKCVRSNLAALANLAYRRPATSAEIAKLNKLVALGEKNGLTLDQCTRLGLEAILVSPQFLYRLQHDPNPRDPGSVHPIGDYELASRPFVFLVEQHA